MKFYIRLFYQILVLKLYSQSTLIWTQIQTIKLVLNIQEKRSKNSLMD